MKTTIDIINQKTNTTPLYGLKCKRSFTNCIYFISSYYTIAVPSLLLVPFTYKYDELINYEAKDVSPEERKFFETITYLGDGRFALSLIGSIYVLGEIENSKEKRVGKDLLITYMISGGITSMIKFLVGRKRPYATNDPNEYKPFSIKTKNTSFPSGHTTIAFQIATVLTYNYKFGFLSYIGAILVALSRIIIQKHWLSDTVMGALIGITVPTMYYHKKTVTIYPLSPSYEFNGNLVLVVFKF